MAQAATPEDAVRLGADAFAIVCFVRGPTEWRYMQAVAEAVRAAERFEMPVICHVYPRKIRRAARWMSLSRRRTSPGRRGAPPSWAWT